MWNKILNWIIGIVFIATVVFSIVQSTRIYFIERELEQYMEQFRLSRERNERYERCYNEAKSYNNELGECLSKHISTISQLREQLAEIRTQYERTRTILEEVEDLCDSDDSLDDIDIGNFSEGNQCTMK